ncbi:hypothetical protein [Oricola indica]|jgi:hypothetical protein|uniref:hypothetical protein n=1 Tax=Oricola indica TaxID=2872591 RepID=UPI001CBFB0CD|nr:hypothetical protein [Oricola indica]
MMALHILPAAALASALTIFGGVVAPGPDDTPTEAELAYADAPYGVDAMVTGPTSKSFRQQQRVNGCDAAKWPDIPLACFPE